MEIRIAKVISYVFHPVFMPVYGLLLLFSLKSYFSFELMLKARLILISFITITSIIFPLTIIALLKRQGFITNYLMQSREERRLPYLITAIFYFLTYQMLKQMQLPEIYSFYFMGATFLLALVVIINFWWKISTHMVGMGGICGMLLGLAFSLSMDMMLLISMVIILSGVVGYARLKSQAHKSAEIYVGFLVGLVVMTGLYLMV